MKSRVVLLIAAVLTAGAAPAVAAQPRAARSGAAPPRPAVVLSTPVFSLRRAPAVLSRVVADTRLGTELDRVMTDPALGGARDRSCLVVGGEGAGAVRYARQGALALIPASTMKLLTAEAALDLLGPDFTFKTEIRAGAPPADGAVGDLFMVGGGDPLLSTADFAVDAGYLRQPRRSTPMEALADRVAATGLRRVGRILGDESRYDTRRLVPSWDPNYIVDFEITPLSALVVNKAFTRKEPPAVAASPPAHAASVLADLLRARGVTVGATGEGTAPAGAPNLTSIESAPLRDVVAEVLQNSDNLGAEMLVKELSARPGTPGSTTAGLTVIAAQIGRTLGVPAGELATVDGSGLDRSDRLSCSVLERLMARAGDSGPLTESLPVAGRNGTLFRRFVGTSAAGKVRAKTGSLEGVAGLAGFATARDGRPLSFALLANALPSASAGSALQDKVATVLAGYPQAPAADELGPRPAAPLAR